MNKVELSPQETALEAVLASSGSRGSKDHEALRRMFARVGNRLRELGDVVVFLDGKVTAVDPSASIAKLISISHKDPATHCVFRMNRCTGTPEPLKDGDRLVDGDELVVTLCKPPQDGAPKRAEALAKDVALLGRTARNSRVVQMRDGQEALLGDFSLRPGDVATCGVVVSAQYPVAGPDWFLMASDHSFDGFTGQRRGPLHEGDLALTEYSVHPPPGTTPTAAEHVLAVVAHRLSQLRRSAA